MTKLTLGSGLTVSFMALFLALGTGIGLAKADEGSGEADVNVAKNVKQDYKGAGSGAHLGQVSGGSTVEFSGTTN